MIKAILFDLDGTLLNRDESVQLFVANQYERLQNHLNHISKETYISRFIHLDNHGYVWKDKVYEQLIREYAITDLTSKELLQDYLENFKYFTVPFPNLLQMLESLKQQDFQLGMITNGFGKFQMDTIEALKIKHYFDAILVSEWEGLKKPDPAIFNRALHLLKVKPTESVYIGDHPKNDINAAQNIGMETIWKRSCLGETASTKYIINDLMEIPSLIKKMNHLNLLDVDNRNHNILETKQSREK